MLYRESALAWKSERPRGVLDVRLLTTRLPVLRHPVPSVIEMWRWCTATLVSTVRKETRLTISLVYTFRRHATFC